MKAALLKESGNSNKIFKNDIFFGLKGKKTNGSKFANDAIKNGASLAIVDKNYKKKHRKIIKVRKPLSLLTICLMWLEKHPILMR